jgi:hypothetical protein
LSNNIVAAIYKFLIPYMENSKNNTIGHNSNTIMVAAKEKSYVK